MGNESPSKKKAKRTSVVNRNKQLGARIVAAGPELREKSIENETRIDKGMEKISPSIPEPRGSETTLPRPPTGFLSRVTQGKNPLKKM